MVTAENSEATENCRFIVFLALFRGNRLNHGTHENPRKGVARHQWSRGQWSAVRRPSSVLCPLSARGSVRHLHAYV